MLSPHCPVSVLFLCSAVSSHRDGKLVSPQVFPCACLTSPVDGCGKNGWVVCESLPLPPCQTLVHGAVPPRLGAVPPRPGCSTPSPSPRPSGPQSKSVHRRESSELGQPRTARKICGQHQKERMSHSLLTFQETGININILDVCPVALSLITVLADRVLHFS